MRITAVALKNPHSINCQEVFFSHQSYNFDHLQFLSLEGYRFSYELTEQERLLENSCFDLFLSRR